MEKIQNICHNILVQTPGVNRVILADKTGLTLVHTSRFEFNLGDVESMGAISSAVYLASEQQGFNVGLEGMSTLVAEFGNGKILVSDCGNAVLCLITDNDVPLGMARMTTIQSSKQIEELLDDIIEKDFEMMEEELTPQPMPGGIEQTSTTSTKKTEEVEEEEEDEFLDDLQSALRELENF